MLAEAFRDEREEGDLGKSEVKEGKDEGMAEKIDYERYELVM